MKNMYVIPAVVAVVVGIGAFYGGMQYQMKKSPTMIMANGQFGGQMAGGRRTGQTGQGGNQMRQGGAVTMGMRPVSGEIINQDETSITVKMEDGSSKIIILSDKTAVNKTSEATKTDLKNGEKVTVFGTTNPDGSVTAQNISLGNMMVRTTMEQSNEASGSTTPVTR